VARGHRQVAAAVSRQPIMPAHLLWRTIPTYFLPARNCRLGPATSSGNVPGYGCLCGGKAPAVDVADTATGYEITAELPGLDEKNIEVKLFEGTLTIGGEKREEKGEKKKDYIIFPDTITVRSNAPSACPTGSMQRRSRRSSRTAF